MSEDILKIGVNEIGKNKFILELSGMIDAYSVDDLNKSLSRLLKNENSIILDLNNVSSMSSLGIAFVVKIFTAVSDFRLVLSTENKLIYDILKHAGILGVVKRLYASQEEITNG